MAGQTLLQNMCPSFLVSQCFCPMKFFGSYSSSKIPCVYPFEFFPERNPVIGQSGSFSFYRNLLRNLFLFFHNSVK